MAKAKTKAAGTNLPVPQNDAEAEQLVARLGALQRDEAAGKAAHDEQVAALEEKRGTAKKVFEEVQGVIVDALNVWATAHRERLTQGGKVKTVQLPTGKLLWRDGKFAVKHRGLKIEDVVTAVRGRIDVVTEAIRRANRGKGATALTIERDALHRFLRTKTELNKDAMLADRDLAGTIPGITIQRGDEEFVVEPLASQIREVA